MEAAKFLGRESVPAVRLPHLDPAQRRAYVIADNKLALSAGWDRELTCSIRASNAASTARASSAVDVFLIGNRRYAQSVSCSAEVSSAKFSAQPFARGCGFCRSEDRHRPPEQGLSIGAISGSWGGSRCASVIDQTAFTPCAFAATCG